jgi:magnesium transporter
MKVIVFNGQGAQEVRDPDLGALLKSDAKGIWVDMTGPTPDEVQVMHNIFKFHPLAIEDSCNQQQRPKIDEYDAHLFAILNPISNGGEAISFRELDVFVGQNYIVTVHPAEEPVILEAEKRVNRAGLFPHMSVGYLLYVMIDVVVDGYFPVLDSLSDEIDELADAVFVDPRPEALSRLFQLKRMLNEVWRIVGPQREMFNILSRRDIPYIDQNMLQHYLGDVYDHMLRISDLVMTYRDTLTGIFDLYMSAVSNRLNKIVNRLTIVTVCVGICSVIVGFYGMNFGHTWPPLAEPWGVPAVIGLMALLIGGLLVIFRKLGWD